MPVWAHPVLFALSPAVSLGLVLWLWGLYPIWPNVSLFRFSAILVLVILRFGVYPLLLAGWSSRRKYALVGAIRGIAQTISYEISLALIFMGLLLVSRRLSIGLIAL